jgi:hypothetical protein
MEQNEAAYLSYLGKGERLFNEAASLQNKAIYEGEIDGTRFKHVAKSFQVKSWRSVKEKWQRLNADQQGVILDIAPLGL